MWGSLQRRSVVEKAFLGWFRNDLRWVSRGWGWWVVVEVGGLFSKDSRSVPIQAPFLTDTARSWFEPPAEFGPGLIFLQGLPVTHRLIVVYFCVFWWKASRHLCRWIWWSGGFVRLGMRRIMGSYSYARSSGVRVGCSWCLQEEENNARDHDNGGSERLVNSKSKCYPIKDAWNQKRDVTKFDIWDKQKTGRKYLFIWI